MGKDLISQSPSMQVRKFLINSFGTGYGEDLLRLKVYHKTTYRYLRKVTLQPHRLIVTPRESGELYTVCRSLECDPKAAIDWSVDVFGNLVAMATFSGLTDRLSITSEAVIEHSSPEWPVFRIRPDAHTFPFVYSLDEVIDLAALAQPDWLTPGGNRVSLWARAFVLAPQTDTLSLLKDLNSGVLGDVTYRVRDEEGTQSPAETLELASGSCRDIAALFIEAARHLGFGARAVSGYLINLDQGPDDPGSTHAWAEIYLPGAGWIAFDPTHQRTGAGHLVPVAYARSNRQILPVTGGYLGDAGDFESLSVDVRVEACA